MIDIDLFGIRDLIAAATSGTTRLTRSSHIQVQQHHRAFISLLTQRKTYTSYILLYIHIIILNTYLGYAERYKRAFTRAVI